MEKVREEGDEEEDGHSWNERFIVTPEDAMVDSRTVGVFCGWRCDQVDLCTARWIFLDCGYFPRPCSRMCLLRHLIVRLKLKPKMERMRETMDRRQ